ncbi:MAG TPA: cupin domain-containing protein [Chitinophagaceae bacterium]|nr:cupin domain-containing protein [Chitinophagaceae bacterium]MCC6635377.1 cupin domain-containing protein [Chitinophagaceae bacterium]HMZ45860.1 cupin domain-containing protein [Chitinophagaceae bacterium]HNE92492.1 cupin domain-containing protein [Chitinophagaceae bacterium]HNF29432.1 cupin domain-containing protein [Chitinophagaceae bacterium]
MQFKISQALPQCAEGKVKGFYGKDFINLQNGTVKLVRVDSFSKYPLHLHPDKTEYAFVVKGNPFFVIDENKFTGEPGDFFIFPKNTKHAIENNTSNECVLLIGAIIM